MVGTMRPIDTVCGAGPPSEVLNSVMRRTADFLPLRHLVLALQDPWPSWPARWPPGRYATARSADVIVSRWHRYARP
jgi:hypothetical protein